MRSQPKLFISDEGIKGKNPQKVLGLLQDIEAAWRRLDKARQARQQLYDLFTQLALKYEHKVSEQTTELIKVLLQHANKRSLSATQRLALMNWIDELLEQLEYSNFLAPQLDIVALREQFFTCFDDEWVTYEQFTGEELAADEPHLFGAAAQSELIQTVAERPAELNRVESSPVDDSPDDFFWPFATLQMQQVQQTMVQQLAAITPCQINYGDGTQEQVKAMLLECYQQLRQNLLPVDCLEPLIELLATYRRQIDGLNSQLANGTNPEGWVWARFGNLNKPEQQPAIAKYVKQLKLELAGLRELTQLSATVKQLKPLLDDHADTAGDFEQEPGLQWPGTYH